MKSIRKLFSQSPIYILTPGSFKVILRAVFPACEYVLEMETRHPQGMAGASEMYSPPGLMGINCL